jgi:ectoine hydroxylase-related dioxygenase (phytanoyl-CoA dioxygenase family)
VTVVQVWQEKFMQTQGMQQQSFNQSTVDWRVDGFMATADAVAPYTATEADIAAFERDGAVLLRGAFSDWVDPLRAGLQRNLDAPQNYAFPCESNPEGAPGRFFDSYCNWQRIPEYRDYVLTSCAASMAGQFMRSGRTQFFHEHAFCKEPGTQRATPWHQDLPYYCVDGAQTASVYVALDPAPAEVAVRFVRGSHRWGKLFYPRVFLDGDAFNTHDADMGPAPDIDADPSGYDILAWDLEPGDTVLFDFRTLHGTTAGEIRARRRAFSTRWMGDDVTFCERTGETSPDFGDHGMCHGDAMREDWFPVLWRAD